MSNSNSSGGISGFSLLVIGTFLVFLVMKLNGTIDWNWFYVTAPLWGAFALGMVFFVIALLLIVLGNSCKKRSQW